MSGHVLFLTHFLVFGELVSLQAGLVTRVEITFVTGESLSSLSSLLTLPMVLSFQTKPTGDPQDPRRFVLVD